MQDRLIAMRSIAIDFSDGAVRQQAQVAVLQHAHVAHLSQALCPVQMYTQRCDDVLGAGQALGV